MSQSGEAKRAPARWSATDSLLVTAILAIAVAITLTIASSVVSISGFGSGSRIGDTVDIFDLEPGDCVAELDWHGFTSSNAVIADCAREHAAELVHRAPLAETFEEYPGAAASQDFAQTSCETTLKYGLHLKAGWADVRNAEYRGVYASELDWADGNKTFLCFLTTRDGEPLIGRFYKADTFG